MISRTQKGNNLLLEQPGIEALLDRAFQRVGCVEEFRRREKLHEICERGRRSLVVAEAQRRCELGTRGN